MLLTVVGSQRRLHTTDRLENDGRRAIGRFVKGDNGRNIALDVYLIQGEEASLVLGQTPLQVVVPHHGRSPQMFRRDLKLEVLSEFESRRQCLVL